MSILILNNIDYNWFFKVDEIGINKTGTARNCMKTKLHNDTFASGINFALSVIFA